MDRNKIKNTYLENIKKEEFSLLSLKRRSFYVSMLRLLVFAAGITSAIAAFRYSPLAGSVAMIVFIVLFFFLFRKSAWYSQIIILSENLIRINKDEINALGGDCSAFDGGADLIDTGHDFTYDTDIFGDDSVFRHINRTVTGCGRAILAGWLTGPYDLQKAIPERQDAVRELSGKLYWRQKFMAYSSDRLLDEKEIDSLQEWLNEKDPFFTPFAMEAVTVILPLITTAVFISAISGLLPLKVFIFIFVFNLMLAGIFLRKSNRIHSMVSRKHIYLSSFAELINLIEKEQFTSSVMTGMQNKISGRKGSAAEKIRELNTIIRSFDSRLNMLAGFILNGFLLWDFQCVKRLERWRSSSAEGLPVWLNLLGKTDAFSSLANYTYNNPGYSFPDVINDAVVLEAFKMGHPLLKNEARVDNDFCISRGEVNIFTGANMSGKSTFLRNVAVNMVLAMAGAPVCAAKMSFSPVILYTSMRTTDSLSRNESYFYAELKRLKNLKDRLENGEDILFILDEILKGTNSTDRSTGSKLFLRRLIEIGGTGLIATHDISLAEMEEEFPGIVMNRCFEVEIDGKKINFDFKIRNGITRNMNASVLMQQMGIV